MKELQVYLLTACSALPYRMISGPLWAWSMCFVLFPVALLRKLFTVLKFTLIMFSTSFVDKISFKSMLTGLYRIKAEKLSTKIMHLNNTGPKEDSAVKFT